MLGSFALLLSLGLASAGETTQVEDFEDLANQAGWIVNPAQDFIDEQGGHDGAFLRTPVVAFAPSPRTTVGIESIFTGNYRARNVTNVGIDLKTFSNTAPGVVTWPLSVVLSGDSGTPVNQSDDCFVFFQGTDPVPPEEVPCATSHDPCSGWRDYEFDIPSQSETLPAGWQVIDFNGCANTDEVWNSIITSVNQLNFHYGDPRFPAPDISWHIGIDNPHVTELGPAPPPGVPDGSDGSPLLVEKIFPNGSRLGLNFDTSSCSGNPDHHVLYGLGFGLPSAPGGIFFPSGAVCAVGGSPFNWNAVPDPSLDPDGLLWFLVLANDMLDVEGSWGSGSSGVERAGPGAGGSSAQCGIAAKDLSNLCGQ
jgi:hypothetical protein